MRHVILCGLALALAIAFDGARAVGQSVDAAFNKFPNPYNEQSFGQLPNGRRLGATSGIDIDLDGKSVWAFERCGGSTCDGSTVAPLLKFDTEGHLVASFGAGMFVYPHGIFVDAQDDIWVTDSQTNKEHTKGNQVVEFSPTGRVLMTLGTPGVTGDGPDAFNQPSDVLVAPNGNIFVADGHGGASNARIVKFDKTGKYLAEWGMKGSAHGEFDTPHGLALDGLGRLLVADRGNSRIQVFDQNGRFITEWKQFGRPSGIFVDRTGTLFVADSQSNTPDANPGVLRGVRIGAEAGRIRFFLPDPDPMIATGGREGVAVDRDGIIYVAKTGDGGLYRYTKGVARAANPATR